ncbi:MAG: flavodoxin family protein [Promethearchaeota archaeon]
MKILGTFFSNTGNTEKVAKAMKEGFNGENVDLIPVKNVDPSSLKSYDLILFGSGIYASRISNTIVNLAKSASKFPSKIAYFCTHASLDFYQKPFKKVDKILEKYDCTLSINLDKIPHGR